MESEKPESVKRTIRLSSEADLKVRRKAEELGWSINAVINQLAKQADLLQVRMSPNKNPYDI